VILVIKVTEINETNYAVSLLGFTQDDNESNLTASVDGRYCLAGLSNREVKNHHFSIHHLFFTFTVLTSIKATYSKVHAQIFSFLKKLSSKTWA